MCVLSHLNKDYLLTYLHQVRHRLFHNAILSGYKAGMSFTAFYRLVTNDRVVKCCCRAVCHGTYILIQARPKNSKWKKRRAVILWLNIYQLKVYCLLNCVRVWLAVLSNPLYKSHVNFGLSRISMSWAASIEVVRLDHPSRGGRADCLTTGNSAGINCYDGELVRRPETELDAVRRDTVDW